MAIVSLLLLWVISPFLLYGVLSSFHPRDTTFRNQFLVLVSMACGPILLSLFLRFLFMFSPGNPDAFYLIFIFLLFCFLIIKQWISSNVVTSFYKYFEGIKQLTLWPFRHYRSASVILFVFLFFTFSYMIWMPILEADALQYSAVSHYIYADRSTALYPVVSPLEDGYYAISSHPLSYYMFTVLDSLLQGEATIFIVKTVSIYYFLCIFMAIYMITRMFFGNQNKSCEAIALVAVFLVLAIPGLYRQMTSVSIDVYRISFSILIFLATVHTFHRKIFRVPIRAVCLTGLVLGCAIYTHSLSLVLYMPIVIALIFYMQFKNCSRNFKSFKNLILKVSLLISFSLIVGGEQYLSNFIRVGSPVSDSLPLFTMVEQLDLGLWRESQQNIFDTTTKLSRLFGGFYSFSIFGPSLLITSLLMVFIFFRGLHEIKYSKFLALCLIPVGIFYGLAACLLLSGNNELIANYRYLLTPILYSCITAAILSVKEFHQLKSVFINPHQGNGAEQIGVARARPSIWIRLKSVGVRIGTAVLCLYFFVYIATIYVGSMSRNVYENRNVLGPITNVGAVKQLSETKKVKFFNTAEPLIPANSITLTFRQNEFGFFLNRNFIRHYDPRMAAFYKAKDERAALKVLKDLGITFIHVPNYSLETISGSFLGTILSSSDMTSLLFSDSFQQLYEITEGRSSHHLEFRQLSLFEKSSPILSLQRSIKKSNKIHYEPGLKLSSTPFYKDSHHFISGTPYLDNNVFWPGTYSMRLSGVGSGIIKVIGKARNFVSDDDILSKLVETQTFDLNLGEYYFGKNRSFEQGKTFEIPDGYFVDQFVIKSRSKNVLIEDLSLKIAQHNNKRDHQFMEMAREPLCVEQEAMNLTFTIFDKQIAKNCENIRFNVLSQNISDSTFDSTLGNFLFSPLVGRVIDIVSYSFPWIDPEPKNVRRFRISSSGYGGLQYSHRVIVRDVNGVFSSHPCNVQARAMDDIFLFLGNNIHCEVFYKHQNTLVGVVSKKLGKPNIRILDLLNSLITRRPINWSAKKAQRFNSKVRMSFSEFVPAN